MRVTAEHVAKIPAENLRVPREVFGIVWRRFEELGEDQPELLTSYLVGVTFTLRWLASQPLPNPWDRGGRNVWHPSPTRYLEVPATPETITDEFFAALRTMRTGGPPRNEVARGAVDAIEWAFYGSGRLPTDFRLAS